MSFSTDLMLAALVIGVIGWTIPALIVLGLGLLLSGATFYASGTDA